MTSMLPPKGQNTLLSQEITLYTHRKKLLKIQKSYFESTTKVCRKFPYNILGQYVIGHNVLDTKSGLGIPAVVNEYLLI
uniref:Uncharacterized protein n=1 Tax=Megaselia scalaris TaxID=36166 RepID=T1H563_MEGSC